MTQENKNRFNIPMHEIELGDISDRHVVAQEVGEHFETFKFLLSQMATPTADEELRKWVIDQSLVGMADSPETKTGIVSFVLFFDPSFKLKGGSRLRGFHWIIMEIPDVPSKQQGEPLTGEHRQYLADHTKVMSCFLQTDANHRIIAFVPETLYDANIWRGVETLH